MKVAQSCLTLCNPMDYTVHGILQARILEWVAFPFSGDLSNPGIEPRSPTLQVDSLPAEPPGKPKNTGVGSLSVLQRIFPTQESNQGLLHCRRILYQLSYQGTPKRKGLNHLWTGWISLLSKGFSRVFSIPQFKSINSSVLSFLYSSTLTSIHDYWKNHSFD